MTERGQSKADRYIALLDAARCNGDWQNVPEIIRKLNKHAPHRKCLIESAHAESSLALSTKNGGHNPLVDPQQFIPALTAAVQSEKTHVEDVLQAQVCLIWLYWTLGDFSAVQSYSPWDQIQNHLKDEKQCSGWTTVSVVKGIYVIGNTYERRVPKSEALSTYASALPLLSRALRSSVGIEFEAWTERLLAGYCFLSSELSVSNLDDSAIRTMLVGFRLWAQHWAKYTEQSSTAIGGNIVGTSRPRRQIWELYHSLLSTILQHDLLYPPSSDRSHSSAVSDSTDQEDGAVSLQLRLQQRAELQLVQDMYERLLLAEVPFPKASEFNEEIVRWLEVVMGNWRIFCYKKTWDERELGDGGKNSSTKHVLDILYRAAAKSFHSTSILRHLFTVHAFLDDFDLAIKALETYIELVNKGRARVLKSGKAEPNLDGDEHVLQTTSEGVKYLCCHTGERAAAKAKEVGILIEGWLGESEEREKVIAETITNGPVVAGEQVGIANRRLPRKVLASGYRAVGVSQAHWSRAAYDAKSREEMRQQAVLNLQRSVSAYYEDTENPDSLFALGLLLAESRELDRAIVAVKRALLRQAHALSATILEFSEAHRPTPRGLSFTSATKYLPLWHLLVLLLSAAQDFDTALNTCEAVISQFCGAVELKGENDSDGSPNESDNPSLPKIEQKNALNHDPDMVKKLESQEKEALLQIKMTQLALIEVTEEPEAAVNASDELLQLYSRLYGGWNELKFSPGRRVLPVSTKPPKSSSGTFRNIRDSLFGKSKGKRRSLQHIKSGLVLGDTHSSPAEHTVEPGESHGPHNRPQIQVVNEYNQVTDSIGHEPPQNLTVQTVGRSHSKKLRKRKGKLRSTIGPATFDTEKRAASANSDALDDARPLSMNSSIVSGASGQVASHNHNTLQSDIPPQLHEPRPQSTDNGVSQVGLGMSHEMPSNTMNALPANELQLQGMLLRGNRPVSRDYSGLEKIESDFERPQSHDMRLLSDDHALGNGSRPLGGLVDHRRYSLLIKVWLFIAGLYRRATMYEDAKGAIDEASTVLESFEAETAIEASTLTASDQSILRIANELRADVLTERGDLAQTQSLDQEALEYFEQAISICMDHPSATVGLCNVLLDYSSGTTAHRSSHGQLSSEYPTSSSLSVMNPTGSSSTADRQPNMSFTPSKESKQPSTSQENVLELDRLAARDRAYGLLLSLTKLATGWDLSSAWFELSRVYEQSGQMENAREVLWRCVELEDRKPIRHWRNVEIRGYVL